MFPFNIDLALLATSVALKCGRMDRRMSVRSPLLVMGSLYLNMWIIKGLLTNAPVFNGPSGMLKRWVGIPLRSPSLVAAPEADP